MKKVAFECIWWKKSCQFDWLWAKVGPKTHSTRQFARKMPKHIVKKQYIVFFFFLKSFFDLTRINRTYLGSSDRAFNRTNKPVMTEKTCQPRRMGKKLVFGFPGIYYIAIYVWDSLGRLVHSSHCPLNCETSPLISCHPTIPRFMIFDKLCLFLSKQAVYSLRHVIQR